LDAGLNMMTPLKVSLKLYLAVDNPILHYPLTGMVTQKSGNSTLDLMPSRHLLFLNV
jgi:hypothetical protein